MRSQAERREHTIKAILESARRLLTARGFAATSIDDIAALAGVAKGAVYHHFESKEEIFGRVFEDMTAEIAARVSSAASAGKDLLDSIGRGTLKYLTLISSDEFRRVLLIDGPAVLGWSRWRQIDARHFGGLMRVPQELALTGRAAREFDALGHLIAGAITEAALVCAASDRRTQAARDHTSALLKMLAPFFTTEQRRK